MLMEVMAVFRSVRAAHCRTIGIEYSLSLLNMRVLFCPLNHAVFTVFQVSHLNITVEILVNAAGMCRSGLVGQLSSDDIEAQINLNVLGTSIISRLFAQGKPSTHCQPIHAV